ncbi:hypothetical protein AKJ37_04245 [candidate division MSBL1 archaeon SCGC-AAA259I09]|uniref:Zinc-ribbon domain-containing protein n=1 Tax=candidate division MSBL1 archaeon SCGC-AAA259I09 TaxID=1698267 RepID=A0A133URP9_9EURY|nr:hypothetical protein AKJ37_04245 [candidate division MSBL1 archaeon SCGC-AAA259I09]
MTKTRIVLIALLFFLGIAFTVATGGLALLLILPVVGILLCIWVYKDAKARGEEAVLWLIVVLITNVVGLIIWLVVRPEKEIRRKKESDEETEFCPNCGFEVALESNFCPKCGEKLNPPD